MEALGVVGFSFGSFAFVFSLVAMGQINKLEKRIERLEGPTKGK